MWRRSPVDMSKPVKVFILLGQSNMVGAGKITGGEGSLENAVKSQNKYAYLVDAAGVWTERNDVRFVRYMSGKGPLNNEWLGIKGGKIGPEYGIGNVVGDAIEEPVMLLKCCIGNRSLAWDLLPPGSERYEEGGKVYAGYKDSPDSWAKGTEPKPIGWYAGKQYDDDTADAKKARLSPRTTPVRRSMRLLDFSCGREKRTAVTPCMQPDTSRISSHSSSRCARISMRRTRSSSSPPWAKPSRAAATR